MRKIIIALLVSILLALNCAALHDILRGEANVWMEWLFLIGSARLLLAFFVRKVRKRQSLQGLQRGPKSSRSLKVVRVWSEPSDFII